MNIRKLLLSGMLAASILCLPNLKAMAYTSGQIVTGGGSTPVTPPSSEEEEEPKYPMYTVYTPKVTLLHNANALCASDGDAIYYIPTLDDLPLDITSYVTNCSTDTYEHKFAYVYNGYFTSEAQMVTSSNVSEDVVSTHSACNIETAYLANPALKYIGYDLLLKADNYSMTTQTGTQAIITNESVPVNDSNLNANVVAMDIYKALGIFEYDLKFCFTKDLSFDANSSPILQELSVITSEQGVAGLNIDESRTDVAVSRTNPNLYWERFKKDGVSRKLSASDTSAASILGLSNPVNENSAVTYGQFCNMAVALMNLYGETALTETEYQACIQAYGADISNINCNSKLEDTSTIYLLAKGIIDPDKLKTIEWDAPVRLLDIANQSYANSNSILDELGRIADVDRRLTIKQPEIIDSALAAAGYSKANVSLNSVMYNYSEYPTENNRYYDFLIEVTKDNLHKAKYSSTDTVSADSPSIVTATETNSKKATMLDSYDAVASMRLVKDGAFIDINENLESDVNLKKYYYYGVQTINGKKYYKFKIHDTLCSGSLAIDYLKAEDEELLTDKPPIVLPNTKGGVYSYSNKTLQQKSFVDCDFTENFIDASTVYNMPLSTGYTTLIFYIDEKLVKQNLSTYNDDIFKWSEMLDSNGKLKKSCSISNVSGYRTNVYPRDNTAEESYIRLEVVTENREAVLKCGFLNTSKVHSDWSSTEGYYRANDDCNSLMVSTTYLKEQKLLTGIKEISKGVWVLTCGKYNNNVIVRTDKDCIIVGDTLYKNTNGECLIQKTNGDIYVNYKCCLGWAGNFAVIPTGESIVAVPVMDIGIDQTGIQQSTVSVSTFFPSADTNTLYIDITAKEGNAKKNWQGISLAGCYALAPYIVVMGEDDTDYLFVWHRDNLVNTSGTAVSNISDDKDKKARNTFSSLTGIQLSAQNKYSLKMYKLRRDNSSNPTGLVYTGINYNNGKVTLQATAGWIYVPPIYDSVHKALDDYAKHDTTLPIPIFHYIKGKTDKFYDANLNVAASSSGDDYLPLGTMPAYAVTADTSKENNYGCLTATGNYDTSKSAGESTKSYSIYTAPVGIFAQIKGLGTSNANNVSGALYFGTSKCGIKNGQITLANRATSFDSKATAVCTYTSNQSSVYAVTSDTTALGDILKSLDTKVGYVLDDPSNVVDWGQYKFQRLIMNLDAWSTVVLIFILNILPRVAILLFFVLMLLSLIANVKPWKMFCQKVFDVYKFLTLGHVSVDTINMKQVFITSLICTCLFTIIMDGQLFNFIIFIAKIFIAFYQR